MLRKSSFVAGAVAAAVLTISGITQAAPSAWTIDQSHSNVTFTIRHIFSKVSGSFTRFSGNIVYDAEKPAASSVVAEIDAASIYTANDRRDTHLKSGDFFDVAKYPTLSFKSTKVTPAGESKLTVEGDLTMHGITKPVILDATFLGSGPGAGDDTRAGFEAVAKVNRKDFSIVWNRNLDKGGTLLGDEVEIRLNIEAIAQVPEAEQKKADAGTKK
jgi:polyisoprenoid-binding protein YceI